jgi:hypothetical protein
LDFKLTKQAFVNFGQLMAFAITCQRLQERKLNSLHRL